MERNLIVCHDSNFFGLHLQIFYYIYTGSSSIAAALKDLICALAFHAHNNGFVVHFNVVNAGFVSTWTNYTVNDNMSIMIVHENIKVHKVLPPSPPL